MKTRSILLSVVLVVAIIQQGYSQLSKGSFLVGGTLSANATTTRKGQPGEATDYVFNVSPDVSYFVMDKLAVGVITPLNYTYDKYGYNDYPTKATTYSIGPAVRYYFSFGSWAIFPIASYTHGWRKTKYDNSDYDDFAYTLKGKKDTFTGGVGVAYFLTRSVSLEGVLSYAHSSVSSVNPAFPSAKSKETETQFNLSVGVQVYLFKE